MSMMKTLLPCEPMHLTDDESFSLKVTPTRTARYRVRVWRSRDAAPVALATPAHPDATPTTWATRKIARQAWMILGFGPERWDYYTADPSPGHGLLLYHHKVEWAGTAARNSRHLPLGVQSTPRDWDFFRFIVGCEAVEP